MTANPAQIGADSDCALGYVRKPFSVSSILAAASLATEGNAVRGNGDLMMIDRLD